jgi:putative membrane protein
MNLVRRWAVITLLCGAIAAPIWAQSPKATAQSANQDKAFLQSAGQFAAATLAFSNAVKDRTPKVTVRAFSEGVIANSHRMRQRLRRLASMQGVTLPEVPNPQARGDNARLSRTAAAELNGQYARLIINQDQAAIAQFQQEARSGSNPLIRDFARANLPMLRGWLTRASEIEDISQPQRAAR